jgi:ATP/maltotriose-dependent transcriptional regulator MalT
MYHKMGKYEKAIELWERSQKMAEEIGDIFGQTVILINLGEVKYHLGQLNQALAYLQAAETLSEQIGDYLCQGECARALGKAYMLFKDFPKAKEYLNKAYQFLEHSGSKLQIGIVLRTLGEVITADIQTKEDQLKASQKFLESIKLLEEIGAWPELIYTHKAYSKFLEKIGDKESAKRHKRISQEILSRIKR